MMNELTMALSWIPVFLVLGAVAFVMDRHFGTRIYRWWYNMTHKEPLPKDPPQGFLFNRQAKARFTIAILLSALQSGIAAFSGINPIVELLTMILEVPVAMVGFYCGPFVNRLWSKKDDVFETVDRIERGELSMSEEVRKVSAEAVETLRDVMSGGEEEREVENMKEETETVTKREEVTPVPEKPAEPEDPRDLMRRYTERK